MKDQTNHAPGNRFAAAASVGLEERGGLRPRRICRCCGQAVSRPENPLTGNPNLCAACSSLAEDPAELFSEWSVLFRNYNPYKSG